MYNFAAKSFHTNKLCSRLYSTEVDFHSKRTKKSLFEPPFRKFGVMYLVGKPVFVILNFFHYLLLLRHQKQKLVEVGVFRRGVGHFEGRFQTKGGVAHQPLCRVTTLLCGIKISAVHHLVLSQSTHVLDRRMDRQTDRITTPKTALAYAHAVKMQH